MVGSESAGAAFGGLTIPVQTDGARTVQPGDVIGFAPVLSRSFEVPSLSAIACKGMWIPDRKDQRKTFDDDAV